MSRADLPTADRAPVLQSAPSRPLRSRLNPRSRLRLADALSKDLMPYSKANAGRNTSETAERPTRRASAARGFPSVGWKRLLYVATATHSPCIGSIPLSQFRTAPLWGVGTRAFFLHDGRTSNLITAIRAHRSAGNASYGPSEANTVIDNYDALTAAQQQDLLNFLRSL